MWGLGKFLVGGLLGAIFGFLVSPKQAQRVRDALLSQSDAVGPVTSRALRSPEAAVVEVEPEIIGVSDVADLTLHYGDYDVEPFAGAVVEDEPMAAEVDVEFDELGLESAEVEPTIDPGEWAPASSHDAWSMPVAPETETEELPHPTTGWVLEPPEFEPDAQVPEFEPVAAEPESEPTAAAWEPEPATAEQESGLEAEVAEPMSTLLESEPADAEVPTELEAEPDTEPVVAELEPEPTAAEPEFTVAEAAPEPALAEPEPTAIEAEPIASDEEPAAAETIDEPEATAAEPELTVGEAEPEPTAIEVEPELTAIEVEPEPTVAEPELTTDESEPTTIEPELTAAEAEPEPALAEPEPTAIEAEPIASDEEPAAAETIDEPEAQVSVIETVVEVQAAPSPAVLSDLRARIEETRRRIQRELDQPFAPDTDVPVEEHAPTFTEYPVDETEAEIADQVEYGGYPESTVDEAQEVRESAVEVEAPAALEEPSAPVLPDEEEAETEPADDAEAESTVGDGAFSMTATDAESQFDHEAMRRRIEETRNRLKAKAFDAMMKGESALLARDFDSPASTKPPRVDAGALDSEVAETIDTTLIEEDI